MFTIMKRVLLISGCVMLLGGIAFYFYQQHRPDPEPIKIYKVPKRVPKQDSPVKTSPVKVSPAASTSIKADQSTHQQSQDTPEISTSTVTDIASPDQEDDMFSDEAIKKWVSDVMEELERLDTYFAETYPEMLEIGLMTKEEILEKYSTPEAQKELIEYVERVQPEVYAKLRNVYSNLPIEIVDDIFLATKEHFIKIWGQETAEQVMRKLRTELGL